jgi:hypothetical protein
MKVWYISWRIAVTVLLVYMLLDALRDSGCSAPSANWIGAPVVGRDEEGGRYHSQPSITSHEIGLREDGVVVWRRVK